MDINTATNYNYTCLSDPRCKPILENSHHPRFFFIRCVMWVCTGPRDDGPVVMATGGEEETSRLYLGITAVSWNSKPVFTEATEVNRAKEQETKCKQNPDHERFRFWKCRRMHWAYSISSQSNLFQRRSSRWIWINLFIQPNLGEALLAWFNFKHSSEFNSISF